jgi:hypothetical protein
VYVNDHGGYYIAETEQSTGYYVYEPVIMRYYGFDPWWYDSWYYSPYYAFYNRYYWPYNAIGWYYPWHFDPWFGPWPGYAFAWHGGHGRYGHHGGWVRRPSALPPTDLLDENGDLPAPLKPVRMNPGETPGLNDSLDRLYREREAMQRGRMAYRPGTLEFPASREALARSQDPARLKLTSEPVKIDRRKLRAVKPVTWPESRGVIGARPVFPAAPSVRSAAPASRSTPAPVSRRRPALLDRD